MGITSFCLKLYSLQRGDSNLTLFIQTLTETFGSIGLRYLCMWSFSVFLVPQVKTNNIDFKAISTLSAGSNMMCDFYF